MNGTRGRRSRALLISAVVVAVGGILAVVWVVFGQTTDTPEESAAPSAEPSGTPTPEPSPTAEPESSPPIVALTEGGALVELDPVSGEVLRTVATNEHWIDLALTADGTTAYLTAQDLDKPVTGPGWSDEVQRVSLVDGASEPVATGWSPAVSPDGRALAYVGVIDVANDVQQDPPYSRALIVLDLTTGGTTVVVDNECVECGRVVDAPRWAPDGSTVYLQVGWGDTSMGTSTVVVAVTPGEHPGRPGDQPHQRRRILPVVGGA